MLRLIVDVYSMLYYRARCATQRAIEEKELKIPKRLTVKTKKREREREIKKSFISHFSVNNFPKRTKKTHFFAIHL